MRTIMTVVCACVVVVAAQAMGAPPVRAVYEPTPALASAPQQRTPERDAEAPRHARRALVAESPAKAPRAPAQADAAAKVPPTRADPAPVNEHNESNEKPEAPAVGGKGRLTGVININTAPAEALVLLPGIGPKMAQRIVARRQRRAFRAAGELRRVRGIGEKKYNKLRRFVVLDGDTTLRKW